MIKYVTILLLSFTLLGCKSNAISESLVKNLVQTPEIKEVVLRSFSVEQRSVVFDVSLYNPNFFPLPVSGISGEIKLNQVAIGSMAAKSDKMLAANSTQIVTLPIQLNTSGFVIAAKKAFRTQQAQYSFNGKVDTSAGTLPVSKRGDLSVRDIISALLPKLL